MLSIERNISSVTLVFRRGAMKTKQNKTKRKPHDLDYRLCFCCSWLSSLLLMVIKERADVKVHEHDHDDCPAVKWA